MNPNNQSNFINPFNDEQKKIMSSFNDEQVNSFADLINAKVNPLRAYELTLKYYPQETTVQQEQAKPQGSFLQNTFGLKNTWETIKDIPSDIAETAKNIGQSVQNRSENIADLRLKRELGERSWLGTTLKQAGQLAGSASDVIGDITTGGVKAILNPQQEQSVRNIVQNIGTTIGESQAFQEVARVYEGLTPQQKEAVDAIGGVAALAGEFIGTGVAKRGATVAGEAAGTALNQARVQGSRLSEYLGRGATRAGETITNVTRNPVDSIIDTVTEGAIRTVDAVREIPSAISNRAKQAVDRRIVRVATETPEVATNDIVNLYKKGIVPGVKGKNKTIASIDKIENSVKESVPRMAKLTDETGEVLYNVENIQDFANAISSEERRIWNQISSGITQAGETGKLIDTKPIIDELVKLMNSERASLSSQLKRTIQSKINELAEVAEDGSIIASKQITPQGAQDFLSDLNNGLQSYYRGSTAGTNADVIVDTLVANNLRKNLDEVVNSLDDTTFRELKRQYGQLKDMEKDVVHRAVFEAQKGQGVSKILDITAAADIGAGLLDPTFLARGIGQFLTKEVVQSLSDKDELIRQMWLYARNLAR